MYVGKEMVRFYLIKKYIGMVYAMFSIGILGFLVWSQLVAFLKGDFEVINYAVCWNSLVSIITFNSENIIGYAQSAGNLSIIFPLLLNNKDSENNSDKSPSETTRDSSTGAEPPMELRYSPHDFILSKYSFINYYLYSLTII